MQRRKFIKDAITGLPVLLLAPSLLANSCGKDEDEINPNDKTVIVVGAGISGLAAAKKLKEKGFNVIILEAQNKVGGRLSTNRTLGISFDEGASWIHGINGNPITTLAQKAGMNTSFTDDYSRISYDIGGIIRNKTTYNNTENELYTILNSMMKSGNENISFETIFNGLYPAKANDRLWKFLLSTYVTFDTGDLNKLSSTLYNEGEEFDGEERIATNGYDTIPKYLAAGLNIQLNQRVSKIDYTNTKIKIIHNDTESIADYVLVTVPPGRIKS